ncbi:MAG TPA: hypothetical protein VGA67_01490, partial [Candidatus Dojkabacteria bacterium]
PTPNPTFEPTPPPNTGPIIYMFSEKNNYAVGESGTIDIKIDSKGEQVNEFRIIIEFDPTHIQIQDSDLSSTGTQVEYLDTFFVPVTNGNRVDTNIIGSETGQSGRITITAQANGDPVSISNRTVAQINFIVLAEKESDLVIAPETSNLLLNSVNQLDKENLEPFTINSTGDVVTTVTVTPTPPGGITINPKTALDLSADSIIFLTIGIALVIIGLLLWNKVRKTDNS